MKDILRSSHRPEQFTIYLTIFSALNIFIVEYLSGLTNNTCGLLAWVGMIGAISAMMVIAARWLWLIKKKGG